MTLLIEDYLAAFGQPAHQPAIIGMGRGIEREALRVLPEGRLSLKPHAYSLGSALTHPLITTDYAENLLEFITPVSFQPETAIAQLQDIQKYALAQLDGELLWPFSMPCYVEDEDKIPLAQYGSSNIGRMKTTYRQGLKNRYGSAMQIIAGIHFNFSFSQLFWQTKQALDGVEAPLQDYISDGYFALLRNYKRYSWLIPYLYGSSPALCSSFLQGRETELPFKKSAAGYLYLEHATSLRMSDLGYTNHAQAALQICYNDVDGYVDAVRKAIHLPSEEFARIGVKVDGQYQQLNSNVLQIENELYAPIRPKRVTKPGEKPSQALADRGVEYIEVRALDVNPFVDTGISVEQIYFLDVFLTYCALAPSPLFDGAGQQACDNNMKQVVVNGRNPELMLTDNGVAKSLPDWGRQLFAEFAAVAEMLDLAYQTSRYSEVVALELTKINDPSLTPSARLVAMIASGDYHPLELAQRYREQQLQRDYQQFQLQYFSESVALSHQQQAAIEQSDTLSFDDYLAHYFAGQPPA